VRGWGIRLMLLLVLLIGPSTELALANEAVPLAEDPVVEVRLMAISEELRCLVCQNESLAGSRADLALDLRREIRTLIKAGKTDGEIMDFMVSRYGDFVRYRPPVKPVTWLLWFGPGLLLVGAIWLLVRLVRGGQRQPTAPALTAAQRARADQLLKDTATDSERIS
jgi:cytochrome c-type biogenesis protein CcmH